MSPELLLFWIAPAAFGLVMGSAVTAIAYRVPRHISWFSGRSACPSCHTQLEALDLVPVFSYVFTRGRCRHCGVHIPWRYPLTELWCAVWSVLLIRHTGLVAWAPLLAIWGYLLIALTWIDFDFKLLPDVLTFPGTLIGVTAALLQPGGTQRALFGVLAGSGGLWLVSWAYLKWRRVEGMGGGDIKLAAMFGVVLGAPLTLLTLLLAAFAGSLWGGWLMLRGKGTAQSELPFGTLLAPAAMIALLWGDRWVQSYLALFHRT
jgi:leader peptidase (prepilin peptidase) / N-methyltransferase